MIFVLYCAHLFVGLHHWLGSWKRRKVRFDARVWYKKSHTVCTLIIVLRSGRTRTPTPDEKVKSRKQWVDDVVWLTVRMVLIGGSGFLFHSFQNLYHIPKTLIELKRTPLDTIDESFMRSTIINNAAAVEWTKWMNEWMIGMNGRGEGKSGDLKEYNWHGDNNNNCLMCVCVRMRC